MSQSEKKREVITQEEIIRLYKNGMSQNDISRMYGVRLQTTRAVLKEAGFDTFAYRKVPAGHEAVIQILVRAGITYRAISKATDISFHTIRDIAERRPARGMRAAYQQPKVVISSEEEIFLSRFLSGESFCMICDSLGLNARGILRCFALLDDTVLTQHSEALSLRLKAEDMSENTITSVARKYGISASVVKAHLNS